MAPDAEHGGRPADAPAQRPQNWRAAALVLLLALLALGYATQDRLAQLRLWADPLGPRMASGVPMMTTLDAYYTLRLARLHRQDALQPPYEVPEHHYQVPAAEQPGGWQVSHEPNRLPLLSRLLAAVAPLFDGSIDRAALVMPPLLASLFMLPLMACCWRLGSPLAGWLGGLVGSLCVAYYQRSGAGWADTDVLNLFFPWMACWLTLEMALRPSLKAQSLLAAGTGATLWLWLRWFDRPGLLLLFSLAWALQQSVVTRSPRRVLLCTGTLLVCAGPVDAWHSLGQLATFVTRYLAPTHPAAGGAGAGPGPAWLWPDTGQTISEMARLGTADTLRLLAPRAEVAAIGLLALLPWAWSRRRLVAALLPVAALGALALFSSRRFAMYLGPFVGIGWGVLLATLGRVLARPAALTGRPLPEPLWCWAAGLALFVGLLLPGASARQAPEPAIPAPVFRSLQQLPRLTASGARLWTWWDTGYALVDTTGRGVYHDGSSQFLPQTRLVAASLASPRQDLLHAMLRYVDRAGHPGIARDAQAAADLPSYVEQVPRMAPDGLDGEVHVLFTPDMPLKFDAIRRLAGAGVTASGAGVRWLRCPRGAGDRLECAQATFDLRDGWMELAAAPGSQAARIALRRTLAVERGRVVREQDYGRSDGPTLQVLVQQGQPTGAFLLDEVAYQSNLNQMFLLGRHDPALFEPVLDDYPNLRLYRAVPRR